MGGGGVALRDFLSSEKFVTVTCTYPSSVRSDGDAPFAGIDSTGSEVIVKHSDRLSFNMAIGVRVYQC